MQTPEGRVKLRLKKMFAEFGTELYSFCPVQSGWGAAGLDFHCAYRGTAFFVETKSLRGKLTKRQHATKERMEQAGCLVFVVCDDQSIATVRDWLCWKRDRCPSKSAKNNPS